MTDFDQLSEKLQKRLPESIDKDLSISTDHGIIFLTNVFKDGHLLGFWSHSPWGNQHDQEVGWAVLNPDLKVVDTCETKTMGSPAGNDFRRWRWEQKLQHGPASKLTREFENECIWRLQDC